MKPVNRTRTTYGLLAEFEDADDLVQAAYAAREAGYRKMDAFTPYPVEALDEALAVRRSPIPLLMLLGGLLGAAGGYLLQYWVAVIQYPLNVGGRPLHSWPAFVPITFETTVLLAALAGFIGVLLFSRLPMPYHPMFNIPAFGRASQDRFFLSIEASDPRFDPVATRRFLVGLKPNEVYDVPR